MNANIKQGKIFVGGLANETTIDSLKKYFETYGELSDCVIMVDKNTNRSRGFGFVTLVDISKVDEVLKNQPHTIDGKQVECKIAIPKDYINSVTYETGASEEQGTYNSRKIFVGGLHPSLREYEMRQYFEQFGKIEQCVIMYDKPTGNSRGFGFILFYDEYAADLVMASKNKHNIMGKWVDCKRAMPKEIINSQNHNQIQTQNQNSSKNSAMFGSFYNTKDFSYLNGSNNQNNGIKQNGFNVNDKNSSFLINFDSNPRNGIDYPNSNRSQQINQNYVVNNYYINPPLNMMKNTPGTPMNNFNNLFESDYVKDNYKQNIGGVVNNNFYYGSNNNSNIFEVETMTTNSNLNSANIFSYEDPNLNNIKLQSQTHGLSTFKLKNSNLKDATNNNNNCPQKGFTPMHDHTHNHNNTISNNILLKKTDYNKLLENENYAKDLSINLGYNGLIKNNLNTSKDTSIISGRSLDKSAANFNNFNSSSANNSMFNIFNNLQSKDSGQNINRPNMFNYFYYKLFDFNGEDLSQLDSLSSYKNVGKVNLFKDDEAEKRKYEVMNDIDIQSVNSLDTEDSSCIKLKGQKENCFGPQKNKIHIKERNFKPY